MVQTEADIGVRVVPGHLFLARVRWRSGDGVGGSESEQRTEKEGNEARAAHGSESPSSNDERHQSARAEV